MAERRDPDADRAVLQHHRWMGYQVSGGVFKRKCAEGFRRWLFWKFYCGFLAGGSLVSGVCSAGICHHPWRRKKWRRTYVKDHDAGSGSSGCDRCHLFDDTSRCHGRSKIFPDPEL